ncbi:MAG: ribosomal RNA small subunit methyltransferase A [Sedimentisphaerales bacterium]|nr:ribosomal RNA small subunit methyltransferase A [Sedimentisphaerales bacterium]
MPHTKQQLQLLLAQAGTKPHHHWGQNFLIDLNLMRLLVTEAQITPADTVLEVGCGTGSMTQLLAQHAHAVIAVDIDPDLANLAQQELAAFDNTQVILTDALKNKNAIAPIVTQAIDQALTTQPGRLLLVANLPYQIAAPLIINLLLAHQSIQGIHVTVQAEVADRMAATPGTKAFGLLSIIMQATGTVKIIRKLKPQAFWPMPQVHSAMVSWQRDPEKIDQLPSVATLKQTIDTLLIHRRKKISTCVAKHPKATAIIGKLAELNIDPNARGETLTVEQFAALCPAWQ